jgi:integrase
LESARGQGIVTGADPVTKANKPTSRTEEVAPLTKRESEALVAKVPEAYRKLTQLLINLGLRIGEALALRTEDRDSPTQRLHVRRTLKRGPAHTHGSPKDAGRHPHDSGKTNPNGLLFPSSGGLYLSSDNFRNRIIQPAAARAGIARHINVHTLRHRAASLNIAAGVDVVRLAAFLGQGDTSTTLDIYAHHLAAKDVIDLVG